jgi:hypothetical protein
MKNLDGLPCQTSYFDWRFGKLLPNHSGPRSLGLCNWRDSGINRVWEILQHHLEIPINQITSNFLFRVPFIQRGLVVSRAGFMKAVYITPTASKGLPSRITTGHRGRTITELVSLWCWSIGFPEMWSDIVTAKSWGLAPCLNHP